MQAQTTNKRKRGRPPVPPEERFRAKYIEMRDGCWLWQGFRTPRGYGQFTPRRGRKMYAHRWAYERWVGPIPPGLEIDHLCKTPACVNPAHLEPVTRNENMRRSRRQFCKRGHRLAGDNVWLDRNGHKNCRACRRLRASGLANVHCGIEPFAW